MPMYEGESLDPRLVEAINRSFSSPDERRLMMGVFGQIGGIIMGTLAPRPGQAFSEVERAELYDFSRGTAEYLHDNHVPNVVYVDRGARLGWVGMKEYWKRAYTEKAPDVFFVDPNGFARSFGLGKRMQKQQPTLNARRDQPVLVMDTCIHTGETLLPILKGLRKAGFNDVRGGVVSSYDNFSGYTPDLILQTTQPDGACHPFNGEATTKHGKGVVSAARYHKEASVFGTGIRAEIRDIIAEGWNNEDAIARILDDREPSEESGEEVFKEYMHQRARQKQLRRLKIAGASAVAGFFGEFVGQTLHPGIEGDVFGAVLYGSLAAAFVANRSRVINKRR